MTEKLNVRLCDWCHKNEGKSFYITGSFICNECRKEAEKRNGIGNSEKDVKKREDEVKRWF